MPPFVTGIVPGTNRVCPRDKSGEIGLPLCRIRRIPGFLPVFTGFVPGTNPVCPWDKSGENWDQPDKKVYVYVPFSCLNFLAISMVFPQILVDSRSIFCQFEIQWVSVCFNQFQSILISFNQLDSVKTAGIYSAKSKRGRQKGDGKNICHKFL